MDAAPRRALTTIGFAILAVAIVVTVWRGGRVAHAPGEAARVAVSAGAADETAQTRFPAFLADIRREAAAIGIGEAVIAQALPALTPDPEVLDALVNQPEFQKTAGEYVTTLASDARIGAGQRKLVETKALLDAIETRFGVDRHILLAIWGIESNFGTTLGSRDVVRSLATLAAFDRRRPAFWRSELLAMLRIFQMGAVRPDGLQGSWAGGMGHTQFIPSAYLAHAIDFDDDGRRDIWNSVADALGSTANYLKNYGWTTAVPWGFEVRLPAGFDHAVGSAGATMTWAQWQALGLVAAEPRDRAGAMADLELLMPAGVRGPAFLVGGNFQAILRYNNATAYALAVGHLADRIAGRPALAADWPAGERGLTRAEREEIQRRLERLGFVPGAIDGMIGGGTRIAIRLFQKVRGLPVDGHADLALLQRLRQEGSE